ncbi:MAG: hypothetical protein NZM26_03450 [Patescibacteria group bacterium]|nr:hypothetical protein [Patescibacteria group bacterium]
MLYFISMIKNVIYPIQAWLLSQGRCVGCGKLLTKAKIKSGKSSQKQVTCDCRRVYILDSKSQKYRRALPEEVF